MNGVQPAHCTGTSDFPRVETLKRNPYEIELQSEKNSQRAIVAYVTGGRSEISRAVKPDAAASFRRFVGDFFEFFKLLFF